MQEQRVWVVYDVDGAHVIGVFTSHSLAVQAVIGNALIVDAILDAMQRRPSADLVIEAGPAVKALIARELSPADAIANGSVGLTGDPKLLETFVALFRIMPLPAAPSERIAS